MSRIYPQVGKSYLWQQETADGWKNCTADTGDVVVTSIDPNSGTVGFTIPGSGIPFTYKIGAWTNDSIGIQVDLGRKVRFRMIEA
jgi:hypothetical protein